MAGAEDDARGAVAQASVLEKDLKDLERLLKADQAAVAAANGGTAGGESARIKQSLRTVLRKLMEAYFNPLNGTHRSQDGHITSSRIVTSHPQDYRSLGSPRTTWRDTQRG